MEIDIEALKNLAKQHNIPLKSIKPAIENAILNAYNKIYYCNNNVASCEMNIETAKIHMWILQYNDNNELIKKYDGMQEGFDKIAANTARNVVFNSLRKSEKEKIFDNFKTKQGKTISGIIQKSFSQEVIKVKLGNLEAILPPSEQVPGEKYIHGKRIKVLIISVTNRSKNILIVVSRSHPDLIKELFALEVPEILEGIVTIVAIAREAGHRTKIAVSSTQEGFNPKGACIGEMGSRVRSVMNEINNEKIDIVDYNSDPKKFISYALSPSKVISINILDKKACSAKAIVPNNQLSLAIGKDGQNARLAAKLTGWKIDIVPETK